MASAQVGGGGVGNGWGLLRPNQYDRSSRIAYHFVQMTVLFELVTVLQYRCSLATDRPRSPFIRFYQNLDMVTMRIGGIGTLKVDVVHIDLMLTELTRTYACNAAPSSLETAFALISDPQPHVRHQALQVLTAAGQLTAVGQQPSRPTAANDVLVDAIFQRLGVVAATDSVSRLRLLALDALAGELLQLPNICCWQPLHSLYMYSSTLPGH